MEEFKTFIDLNRHKFLSLMIENAKILLAQANETGLIGTTALQIINSRFEDPGIDHRKWFKPNFWTIKISLPNGDSENGNFTRLGYHLGPNVITLRRGACLTNTAKAFHQYYNTLAHTHRVRPYSIMAIVSALTEMTNELDFAGDEQTKLFSKINNHLKKLLLDDSTFLKRLFDIDGDNVEEERTDPDQIIEKIAGLVTENDSRLQETIAQLENQVESITDKNISLKESLSELKNTNDELSEETRLLKLEDSSSSLSESHENGDYVQQTKIINEIEFDPDVLEKMIELYVTSRDHLLFPGSINSTAEAPEFADLLDSLNTIDDGSSRNKAGYFLRELLLNFQDAKIVGFSTNLHNFIASLWFDISGWHTHVDDLPEFGGDSMEESSTNEGDADKELTWDEIKIELDELRKEIKSVENLENWENPLMRRVIERVGEGTLVSIEQWKGDEIIRHIYNEYDVDLDHYLRLIEQYWPAIEEILEDWIQT